MEVGVIPPSMSSSVVSMKNNIIIMRITGFILLFIGFYPFIALYINSPINQPPGFNWESVNTANTVVENVILNPGLTGLKIICGVWLILLRPGAKLLTCFSLSVDILMRFFTYATPSLPPYAGWETPEFQQLFFLALAGRANLYRTRPDEIIHLNPISLMLAILQIIIAIGLLWIYFLEKKKKTQKKNSTDAVPAPQI